jgi:hypothetical protein
MADGPSLGRNAKQAAREGALPVALEMCDVPIWFQVRCNGAAWHEFNSALKETTSGLGRGA